MHLFVIIDLPVGLIHGNKGNRKSSIDCGFYSPGDAESLGESQISLAVW